MGEERIVLEHHADVAPLGRQLGDAMLAEVDLARIGELEASDGPEGRGLPAPGGTEQRHQLAVADIEVQVVDGDDGAKRFVRPLTAMTDIDAEIS